jgi:hypothetical protein
MGDIRGEGGWMEVKLDGKNPKKEEKKERHPRAQVDFFYDEEKSP